MIDFQKTSRKLMISCLICLTIFVLIFAVMYKVLHVKPNHAYRSNLIIINKELPKFSLPMLNNSDMIIDQNILKNKITVINIWCSSSRFCRQEHQILLKIAKDLKDKAINFIGVSNCDDQETAMNWLSVHGDPYKINLFDQKGKLAIDARSKGLPELFIIDDNQKIQYRYSGLITTTVLKKEISPILEQLYLHTNQ